VRDRDDEEIDYLCEAIPKTSSFFAATPEVLTRKVLIDKLVVS
jgi:hypothetical protein